MSANKTILLIDDDPAIAFIIQLLLEKDGFLIRTANSGAMALRMLGEVDPQLIISDVVMPGMSGLELVQAVRMHRRFRDVPFIFLSAATSWTAREEGFASGADYFLPKPVDGNQLRSAVRSIFRLIERLAAAKVPPATGDGASLTGSLDAMPLVDVIQALEAAASTGSIMVSSVEDSGVVVLREGRVASARLEGASGPLRAKNALYRLLSLKSGTFSFQASDITGEDEFGASTSNILLQWYMDCNDDSLMG